MSELLTREIRRHGSFWCLLTVAFTLVAGADVYLRPDAGTWIWCLYGVVLPPMLLAKVTIVEERVSGELRRLRDHVGDSDAVVRAKTLFLALAEASTALLVLVAGWSAQQIWGNVEFSLALDGLMSVWISAVAVSVIQAGTALVWDVRWRWAVPSLLFLGVVVATGVLWTRGDTLADGWTRIEAVTAPASVVLFVLLAVAAYRLAMRSVDEGLEAERQGDPIQLKLREGGAVSPRR